MLTHSIINIVPTMEEGRLVRLAFTARSADDKGHSAEIDVDLADLYPELEGYTDVELTPVCMAIAAARNLFASLDVNVGVQATPVMVPPPPVVRAALTDHQTRTIWMGEIDNNVALVMTAFTRFQMEYEMREDAALVYKAKGYTGDPTTLISRFADNVGISYRACADLVIGQAIQLRGAVAALGDLRMDKYRLLAAPSLAAAETEFNRIIHEIALIAGSLP
ncbi:MAG: hypothetical protein WKF61_01075 [Luteimonas sp.]